MAQLVRAPPCHGGGRGFESHSGRFLYGVLAQLGEHLPYKQRVTGSSPVGPSFYKHAEMAQLAEQLICNQQVIGSSPIIGFLSDSGWYSRQNRTKENMGEFPSGQRGQTVNLLAVLSVVRIHLPPLKQFYIVDNDAGWSSSEARRAHNPKVVGSNPTPATRRLDVKPR